MKLTTFIMLSLLDLSHVTEAKTLPMVLSAAFSQVTANVLQYKLDGLLKWQRLRLLCTRPVLPASQKLSAYFPREDGKRVKNALYTGEVS